jgi:hypothetical protein
VQEKHVVVQVRRNAVGGDDIAATDLDDLGSPMRGVEFEQQELLFRRAHADARRAVTRC